LAVGEQVHGNQVAVVRSAADGPWPGIDGLVTAVPGVALGVHVADCGAVFLADPVRRAVGLVHSGRKGTESGIVSEAIRLLGRAFGTDPADLVVVLGPCIRPPAYEVDFAAAILAQCREAGVPEARLHDAGVCTARDAERYYSYRREKGRTGRHLAILGWRDG
jgi:copper oxidase (laccase) domain-containing protein